jgi:hypothetical protein
MASGLRAGLVLDAIHQIPQKGAWEAASIVFACAVAVVCLAFGVLGHGGIRRVGLSGVLAVEAAAFFVVPELSAPRHVVFDSGPVSFLQAHLGTSRFFTLGPIQPNYGSYWRIPELDINDLPIPASYAHVIRTELDRNVNPVVFTGTTRLDRNGPTPLDEFTANMASYEEMGVRYLVDYTSVRLPPALHLTVAYQDRYATIYELPDPAPMYSPPPGCTVAGSSLSSVTVDCTRSGQVRRRELFLPGWSAQDNSRPVALRRDGPVFQQVAVHPGRNRITFGYEPPHTTEALVAALAGLALLGAVLFSRVTGMAIRPVSLRRCSARSEKS